MKLRRYFVTINESFNFRNSQCVEAEEVDIREAGQLVFKLGGHIIAAFSPSEWCQFTESVDFYKDAAPEAQEKKW